MRAAGAQALPPLRPRSSRAFADQVCSARASAEPGHRVAYPSRLRASTWSPVEMPVVRGDDRATSSRPCSVQLSLALLHGPEHLAGSERSARPTSLDLQVLALAVAPRRGGSRPDVATVGSAAPRSGTAGAESPLRSMPERRRPASGPAPPRPSPEPGSANATAARARATCGQWSIGCRAAASSAALVTPSAQLRVAGDLAVRCAVLAPDVHGRTSHVEYRQVVDLGHLVLARSARGGASRRTSVHAPVTPGRVMCTCGSGGLRRGSPARARASAASWLAIPLRRIVRSAVRVAAAAAGRGTRRARS